MRQLHQFKVGEEVQVKPEEQKMWKSFSNHAERDRIQYTVTEVREHPEANHAWLEECKEPNCAHHKAHNQLLTLDGLEDGLEDDGIHSSKVPIEASGYWFIPVTE